MNDRLSDPEPHHHVTGVTQDVTGLRRVDGARFGHSNLCRRIVRNVEPGSRPSERCETRAIETNSRIGRITAIRNTELRESREQCHLMFEVGVIPRVIERSPGCPEASAHQVGHHRAGRQIGNRRTAAGPKISHREGQGPLGVIDDRVVESNQPDSDGGISRDRRDEAHGGYHECRAQTSRRHQRESPRMREPGSMRRRRSRGHGITARGRPVTVLGVKSQHNRHIRRATVTNPVDEPKGRPDGVKTAGHGHNGVVPTPPLVPPTTVAVLLAAGAGSRFRGPTHKLLAPIHGRTVIEIALDAVMSAGFERIIVVTGAVELPSSLVDHANVSVHHNPRWHEGQATSVGVAVEAATEYLATAMVVGLADQPFITADAWQSVAATNSPIAVATYDGIRGNPVRLSRDVWSLLPTTGDTGARELMRLRPELVSEVACEGSAADIDTQEDLAPWT